MRFGVLGQLEVLTGEGRPVVVPERKVRTLLAALLVAPGRPVAGHRLVDDLWGEAPPGRPSRALQAKVSQLRRALDEAEPGGRDLVATRDPGYALDVPAETAVDAGVFGALAARARGAAELRVRAELFAEALGLWRGPAFAGFEKEPFARAAIDRLEEERLTVREELAEVRLALGEHRELTAELRDLVARNPLRERLRAVQLRALYRSGRQTEALAAYEELRSALADDLGLDPGPELVALQRQILTQDPALEAGPGPGAAQPSPSRTPPAPAPAVGNLPTPLTDLVGREAAVAEVRALIRTRRLLTLTGAGGVGRPGWRWRRRVGSPRSSPAGCGWSSWRVRRGVGSRRRPSPRSGSAMTARMACCRRRSGPRPRSGSPRRSGGGACYWCSTTASTSPTRPPTSWRCCCAPARSCGSSRPANRRWRWRARRCGRWPGSRPTPPPNSSPRARRPPTPASTATRPQRRRYGPSAAVSTASPWRWSWRPPGCARWACAGSSKASTTASASWPRPAAERPPGSRPCAR